MQQIPCVTDDAWVTILTRLGWASSWVFSSHTLYNSCFWDPNRKKWTSIVKGTKLYCKWVKIVLQIWIIRFHRCLGSRFSSAFIFLNSFEGMVFKSELWGTDWLKNKAPLDKLPYLGTFMVSGTFSWGGGEGGWGGWHPGLLPQPQLCHTQTEISIP